jgi:hypothetical protein
MEWDRFAARLSGPSSAAPDPDRNQVFIPWPALKLPKTPARTSDHTRVDCIHTLIVSPSMGRIVR